MEHNEGEISKQEMNNILNELSKIDSERLPHEEKSTRIGLIDNILGSHNFDPNTCLSMSLHVIKHIQDIGLISVCLSHKAKPNIYIDTKGLGPAHILLAAYTVMPEDVFKIFYYYMVMKGSNPSLPCYDSNADDILGGFEKKPMMIVTESVHEWLKNKNLELPVSSTIAYSSLHSLSPKERLCLSVLMNNNLIEPWDEKALEFICLTRISGWQKINISIKDSLSLKMAFKCTFPELFSEILSDGIIPSYYDICYFISHMASIYRNEMFSRLKNNCRTMLIDLIRRGVPLDLYQVDEIGNFDPEFRVILIESYRKPLWQKVCSIRTDSYIPKELSETTLFFGISTDATKNSICSSFEDITTASLEALVKSFKKKNSRLMAQKTSLLTDFINAIPEVRCENLESISGDPTEFSDKALAYYRDNDGKNWCFLSNSFENLISTGVNPATSYPLPKDFLATVKSQKEFLELFGIPLHDPKTISKIMKSLNSNQEISNDETNTILSRVGPLLDSRMFSEKKIKQTTLLELITRFSKIGVILEDYIEITEDDKIKSMEQFSRVLSPHMVYILICRMLFDKFTEDIQLLEKFTRK